ncbi:Hypothetical Protein FCC1311_076572 [Hondaea fermentalgiana]|uniref:Uncharacterized protein n=1 Tax=Hondaea fermentalgiana TaxID=2315210 RepID=A0A2R5GS11_9STRA|nr:Hypothetical Protein FCC1311_076572 [Hondaea fermentalgiana]|eukprot:GBG31433.1 Hypothetical Protein FCC1311_076572 [Hondaea fermentalgiana]
MQKFVEIRFSKHLTETPEAIHQGYSKRLSYARHKSIMNGKRNFEEEAAQEASIAALAPKDWLCSLWEYKFTLKQDRGTALGQGDLCFLHHLGIAGQWAALVVETKHLKGKKSDKEKREKVTEQAKKYLDLTRRIFDAENVPIVFGLAVITWDNYGRDLRALDDTILCSDHGSHTGLQELRRAHPGCDFPESLFAASTSA